MGPISSHPRESPTAASVPASQGHPLSFSFEQKTKEQRPKKYTKACLMISNNRSRMLALCFISARVSFCSATPETILHTVDPEKNTRDHSPRSGPRKKKKTGMTLSYIISYQNPPAFLPATNFWIFISSKRKRGKTSLISVRLDGGF